MLDKTSKLRKTVSIKRPTSFRQYLDDRVSGRARIEKNNQQKKKINRRFQVGDISLLLVWDWDLMASTRVPIRLIVFLAFLALPCSLWFREVRQLTLKENSSLPLLSSVLFTVKEQSSHRIKAPVLRSTKHGVLVLQLPETPPSKINC